MSDNVTNPTGDLRNIHSAYIAMVGDLEKLIFRAEGVIGRLYGSQPVAVEPAPETKPSGLVSDMNAVRARFSSLLDRAKSVVAKIEGAV